MLTPVLPPPSFPAPQVKDSLDPGTQQVETQAQPTPHRPAGGARVLETAAAAA